MRFAGLSICIYKGLSKEDLKKELTSKRITNIIHLKGGDLVQLFTGLTLNARDPVYLQLVRYVHLQICRGILQDGDALPSRRELAVQLGINPNTVQKAYKALEEEGLMRTDGNSGSVARVTPQARDRLLAELKSEAAQGFIESAQALGLTFQQAVALITQQWPEE